MNNNNNKKPIRIACVNGKHRIYYAELDADGNVEYLKDEVELIGNDNISEFISLIDLIVEAKRFPIVMVNACNKALIFGR